MAASRSKTKRRGEATRAPRPANDSYDSSGFLALDEGHAIIKGCTDATWAYYPHAVMPIDDNVWRQIKMRGTPSKDYFVINGKPYAIGETAENHGWEGRLEGASRYIREYYGTMAAAMMFRTFLESKRGITVFATHAPEYIDYRENIRESLVGEWQVECSGEKRVYTVRDVFYADEPVAGSMNVILTERATGFQHEDLQHGTGLVLDIGGFTTDATLLENGTPDYQSIITEPGIGIIRALEEFKKGVRSKHSTKLQNVSIMRPEKLRRALITGQYEAGGYGKLDCQQEADTACNRLVSLVNDIYKRFGGTASLDFVILTGGGSGVLAPRLKKTLGHPNLYLADKPDLVHMANVTGALKMMHFYKRFGAF